MLWLLDSVSRKRPVFIQLDVITKSFVIAVSLNCFELHAKNHILIFHWKLFLMICQLTIRFTSILLKAKNQKLPNIYKDVTQPLVIHFINIINMIWNYLFVWLPTGFPILWQHVIVKLLMPKRHTCFLFVFNWWHGQIKLWGRSWVKRTCRLHMCSGANSYEGRIHTGVENLKLS